MPSATSIRGTGIRRWRGAALAQFFIRAVEFMSPVIGGRPALRFSSILICLVLLVQPGAAQTVRRGQWWWDGGLELGAASTVNTFDGDESTSFDSRDLRVDLGLHGYAVHPEFSSFNLNTGYRTARLTNGDSIDFDSLDLAGDVEIMPRGKFPLWLSALRQNFDYTDPEGQLPAPYLGAVKTVTQYDGLFGISKGVMSGLRLGIVNRRRDFFDSGRGHDSLDRQYLRWNRQANRFHHELALEHRQQDYRNGSSFDLEDFRLRFDETASLSSRWDWRLNMVTVRRETQSGQVEPNQSDDFRMNNTFLYRRPGGDILNINTLTSLMDPQGSPNAKSHRAAIRYRWSIGRGMLLGPFGTYSSSQLNGASVSSPRVGLDLNWRREKGNLLASVFARGAYDRTEQSDASMTTVTSGEAMSFNANLTHRSRLGAERGIELIWSLNDLDLDRRPIDELPDLGPQVAGFVGRDTYVVRLQLRQPWDSRWVRLWVDWEQQQLERSLDSIDQIFESTRGGIEYGTRRLNMRIDIADTTLQQPAEPDQSNLFATIIAQWSPLDYLSFRAFYRDSRRNAVLGPSFNDERFEASFRLRLGRIFVEGFAADFTEELVGSASRRRRSYRVAISTRFGGGLPIVTGTDRRGIIR